MTRYSAADLQRVLSQPDYELSDPHALEAPPRSLAGQSEASIQAALFAYIDGKALADARYSFIFHPANGEWRHPATGAKLKKMGVRPGVLDVCVPIPAHGYHSLWIELKVSPNKVTSDQQRWIDFLQEQGHCVSVIWDDVRLAIELIDWYVEGCSDDAG
jgi:hypothetical protein